MEGRINLGFSAEHETSFQIQETSEFASQNTSNSDAASDHYESIHEDKVTGNARLRKLAPPRLKLSINEPNLNQRISPKDNDEHVLEPYEPVENVPQRNTQRSWKAICRGAASDGVPWLVHVCVFAYFVAAIVFWNMKGDCDLEWCDGFGMLIIVLAVTYIGIFYYQIVKKYFGKTIYENVLHPVGKQWSSLMKQRFLKVVACLVPVMAIVVYLVIDTIGNPERLISAVGMIFLIGLGYIFSKHRTEIRWRPVLCGLGLQFLFGLITIRWSVGRNIFQCIGDRASIFLSYSDEGARFVFGNNLIDEGIFAFKPMSVIFFLSFIVQILYYYGAMQWFVIKLGWFIQVTMGTTVCESVNSAASIFLGMSESPLLFKPYIKDLTKSELHAVMTEGFATVAGTVLAAYISFKVEPAHLITASVMSAPAALCFSKLFYPETEESKNKAEDMQVHKSEDSSVLDAATKGALAAIQLVLGIIANIIAFVAFIAFLNGLLSWLGTLVGLHGLTLEFILGKVLIPLAWLMGVEWSQCEDVARLIGLKTIVNEFVAYEQLGQLKIAKKLSPRSEMIATYALCGFSNPGSIGISIGTLSTMAPNQKSAITEVAVRAFIAGSATCFLTACIAGLLMPNDFYPEIKTNVEMPIFNVSFEVPQFADV
ncbi:uncharacterized transporter YutK-like isoform X2 [Periplaneta americana]|uniref:uncharacterized transporter YutK-like isoform X2 n=1 Tax=Periplaneta americana TaxID=6978 RepID=UPI0037E9859E